MYHQTLKDHMFNTWSWIRHIGWMYAVALIILATVGYGGYLLAIANPVIKLSLTLGTILAYNLLGVVAKRNHLKEGLNEKLGKIWACSVLMLIPIGVYCLVLSAFVVPWFLSTLIFLGLGFAIALTILDEKKIAIPRQIFWLRNVSTILSFVGLIYYLAKYLG